MTPGQLRKQMLKENLSLTAGSMPDRLKAMERVLWIVLTPRTISDRTCHRRVMGWIGRKILTDAIPSEEILARCLAYALEASGPLVRNPHALFMSLLKKELNYPY